VLRLRRATVLSWSNNVALGDSLTGRQAAARGVLCLDAWSMPAACDPDLFGRDRIHPNASGHQLMAAACKAMMASARRRSLGGLTLAARSGEWLVSDGDEGALGKQLATRQVVSVQTNGEIHAPLL
jgi:hypothetical protein